MSEPTPGPWTANEPQEVTFPLSPPRWHCAIHAGLAGPAIAFVYAGGPRVASAAREDVLANARLIAAAPDLAGALLALVALYALPGQGRWWRADAPLRRPDDPPVVAAWKLALSALRAALPSVPAVGSSPLDSAEPRVPDSAPDGPWSHVEAPPAVLRKLLEEREQREIWQRTAMERKEQIEELRAAAGHPAGAVSCQIAPAGSPPGGDSVDVSAAKLAMLDDLLRAANRPDAKPLQVHSAGVFRFTSEQVADNSLPPDFLEREAAKAALAADADRMQDELEREILDPDPERHLRREANSLAFEVRNLLAALSGGGRPGDRILASLGCRLAAYELAADEVALLRAVGEDEEAMEVGGEAATTEQHDLLTSAASACETAALGVEEYGKGRSEGDRLYLSGKADGLRRAGQIVRDLRSAP